MQYYNTSNTENSLVHQAWYYVDADINSYPLADVTRNFNLAQQELVLKVINADGTWQFDDTNNTTTPRGTGTLVEGQQSYSFAEDYLSIEMVEIKMANGQWQRIRPIDHSDYEHVSPDEYWGLDNSGNPTKGMPEEFDQVGDTMRFYPAPSSSDVTLSGGLRVTFKRKPIDFAVSDTTKEPAIPVRQDVLCMKAALPQAKKYKRDRVKQLVQDIKDGEEEIINHYALRERTRSAGLTMSNRSGR